MTSSPPSWQAHKSSDYDSAMTAQCSTLLDKIIADPKCRQAILADPRALHRELFADFAPAGYSEYAGSYRGTPGTSLLDREVSAESQLESGLRYEFCPSSEVPERTKHLLQETINLMSEANADDFAKLLGLTYTFCWFGKIHPFLDGNGHVQRAIFASMATEFGFPLSPRFAIHPRPYDRLLAIALEIFARAPVGDEIGELSMVAEYLAFFLDGPFNGQRKHVATETLYT